MIILHHLNNSRSQRILWLLEELQVPYNIKFYKRNPKTMLAPKELKEIHPMGKSPVLEDGKIKLAESGAIIEYIIKTYGKERFSPDDEGESLQALYWLHFSEGSLMPQLLLSLVFEKLKTAPLPFFVKPIVKIIVKKVNQAFIGPEIKTRLDHINKHLKNNEWFAGKTLTGADFQMIFPLEAAKARGHVKDQYPFILSYIEKVQKRPTYQEAVKKGGHYKLD